MHLRSGSCQVQCLWLASDVRYIKLYLSSASNLQGAVLIGETELEETFENLILDGIDLSQYGPEFMDPEIDLQEVFD